MGVPVASKMLPEKENCTQDFLNAGQYKRNGILRYERVFGHTFVSTGGLATTKDIVDPIGLKPGMKVLGLDVARVDLLFTWQKISDVKFLVLTCRITCLPLPISTKQQCQKMCKTWCLFATWMQL